MNVLPVHIELSSVVEHATLPRKVPDLYQSQSKEMQQVIRDLQTKWVIFCQALEHGRIVSYVTGARY